MKAFIVHRYGSKDGVRLGEMPEPTLGDDDVLVQVHAASVNPLDSKIRNGEFKLFLPYRVPFILGNDVAGVVVRVGSRVRRLGVSERSRSSWRSTSARPARGISATFKLDRRRSVPSGCSVASPAHAPPRGTAA